MKNTDRTKEIEFSAGSYPSFICVYPVNLWFDCSKLLLKRTVLSVSPTSSSTLYLYEAWNPIAEYSQLKVWLMVTIFSRFSNSKRIFRLQSGTSALNSNHRPPPTAHLTFDRFKTYSSHACIIP